MAFLEIQNLSSGYGELQILWDVSLELEAGKLTALVGSNGVGKTTLLRTVVGLLKPWQGSVTFEGRDVTRVSPHTKAAQGVVLVPEGRQLFTEMSVYENLEMGALPSGPRRTFRRIWNGFMTCSRFWRSGATKRLVLSLGASSKCWP